MLDQVGVIELQNGITGGRREGDRIGRRPGGRHADGCVAVNINHIRRTRHAQGRSPIQVNPAPSSRDDIGRR